MTDLGENTVASDDPGYGRRTVALKVNGQEREVLIDPRTTLLDCLREVLHLTGTKKGCDHGQCGACTVHIGGRRMNCCLALPPRMTATTSSPSKGSARPGRLHPMQAAFLETMPINAAIAHRARSCRPWRCCANHVGVSR